MRRRTNDTLAVLQMAETAAQENEKKIENETAYMVIEADLVDLLNNLRGDTRVRHLAQSNKIHGTGVRAIHLHCAKGYNLWLREDGVTVKTPTTECVSLENIEEQSAHDLITLYGTTAMDLFYGAFTERHKQEQSVNNYGKPSVYNFPV